MIYDGNVLDTTSVEQFTDTILNKIVKQEIDQTSFDDPLTVFNKEPIGAGFQIEEIAVGNLDEADFDPEGSNSLTKKKPTFKTIYHKKNYDKQMKVSVSDKQIRTAMLSKQNVANLSNAIVSELSNSATINRFEDKKQLIEDVCTGQKNINLLLLNQNNTMDDLSKVCQILNTKMKYPSKNFNYLAFKKTTSRPEDLYILMDSETSAQMNVDSLASAFNMDKKTLAGNIIVLDDLPTMEYTALTTNAVTNFKIGENKTVNIVKYASDGTGSVTGKVKMLFIDKKAFQVRPEPRTIESARNAAGRFTNYFLNDEGCLSYSALKNAIAIVDNTL